MFKLGLAALPLIPGGGYGSSHVGGYCAAAHFGREAVVVFMLGGGYGHGTAHLGGVAGWLQ